MVFGVVLGLAALIAAAVAAVAGFGIGSILTPVLAIQVGTKLAVAAVAIPHFVGTAQRFWILRRHVDREVVLRFGLTSALGGLAGALLHATATSSALDVVFGLLLVLAGISELTGWMRRVRWGRRAAWVAGALSGVLGGLVGNQGGIRAASMLGFQVPKESFVATATAIGLFVDAARLPVYLATQGPEIARLWDLLLVAIAAVILGTALGTRLLARVPPPAFRRVVATLLLLLGLYMIAAGGGASHAPRAVSGSPSEIRSRLDFPTGETDDRRNPDPSWIARAASIKEMHMPATQPEGHLATPAAGHGSAVLVLHAWWGLNDTMKRFCGRLAESGFVAFAPDLYHGKVAATIPDAQALSDALDGGRAKADVADAMRFLKERAADADRGLAVIGFSLGAYLALELSVTDPDEIRSVVVFYGTRTGDYSASKASYMGHFAEMDEFEPKSEVDAMEEALKTAGRPATFHRYPGTGHWFFEPDRPDAFQKEEASLAWDRTLAFLKHPPA